MVDNFHFYVKRKSFEHEREVRAIVQIFPMKEEKSEKFKPIDFSRDMLSMSVKLLAKLILLSLGFKK